jgi:hypothetical protein
VACPHRECGRSTNGEEPDHSDCEHRVPRWSQHDEDRMFYMRECAESGCGFCEAELGRIGRR